MTIDIGPNLAAVLDTLLGVIAFVSVLAIMIALLLKSDN